MQEWCTSPYEIEIEKYMKRKESKHYFTFESPQLSYRPDLVDWLKNVAVKFKLRTVTIHLAIFLMDRFMDNHCICKSKLCPIGLVCLLIAAKFEERNKRLSEIKEALNYCSAEGLVTLEHTVLDWFDWTINIPTAGHFAEHYARHAVLPGDTDPTGMSILDLKRSVLSSMAEYLEGSLKVLPLLLVRGSAVAACCLLAARRRHSLTPLWPPSLASITEYTRAHLTAPLWTLIQCERKSPSAVKRKRVSSF